MPKIEMDQVQTVEGSRYPAPFDAPCRDRKRWRVGDAAGLTRVGVHVVRLGPGAWSSQRHWHTHEDELVYVLEGELVLVEDGGETVLRAGDFAGWPAGTRHGHHLQNRTQREAAFIVVGTRDDEDSGEYPDIDLAFAPGRYSGGGLGFRHKDGRPYRP